MLTAKEVRELLRENIVEVVFVKKDGTDRKMFCTLINEFLPSRAEEIVSQGTEKDDIITCWDLEHDAWRSFRLETIKSLEAEPVE